MLPFFRALGWAARRAQTYARDARMQTRMHENTSPRRGAPQTKKCPVSPIDLSICRRAVFPLARFSCPPGTSTFLHRFYTRPRRGAPQTKKCSVSPIVFSICRRAVFPLARFSCPPGTSNFLHLFRMCGNERKVFLGGASRWSEHSSRRPVIFRALGRAPAGRELISESATGAEIFLGRPSMVGALRKVFCTHRPLD